MGLTRVLVVVVICVILLAQAQQARGLPYRRRSMLLGAAAFGVLALGNILQLLGVSLADYSLATIGLPLLLMLASVVLLVLSWRAGERRAGLQQARRSLADEIKRRRGDS